MDAWLLDEWISSHLLGACAGVKRARQLYRGSAKPTGCRSDCQKSIFFIFVLIISHIPTFTSHPPNVRCLPYSKLMFELNNEFKKKKKEKKKILNNEFRVHRCLLDFTHTQNKQVWVCETNLSSCVI